MATVEHIEHQQPLPTLLRLGRYGAELGVKAIFHREEELDEEPALVKDPTALATWADAGYHYAMKAVRAVLGSDEKAATEPEALPYDEAVGRITIGRTHHAYTLRKPKEGENSGRVLYILNGLTASQEVYHELARQLTLKGETTVVSQEAQGPWPNPDRRHYTAPETLASQGAYGVMKDIRGKYGDKQFVLIGHSLGGATSTNAGTHMPEWIEHVVHLESTGVDDHNIIDMILRTKDFVVGELFPALPHLAIAKNGPQLGLETLKRTGTRPLRFSLEAIKAGRTNLRPRIESLRKNVPSIGWVAIQGESSLYFPIDKVRSDAADLYDGFYAHPRPGANHLFPLLFPVSTSEAILQALDKVDHKKTLAALDSEAAIAA